VQRSKLALVAGILGVIGLVAPFIGAGLAHFEVIPPLAGFALSGLGLLCALIAGLLGLAALYSTRAASNRSGRPLAWVGVLAGLFVIGVIGFVRRDAPAVPPINDISTDLVAPPVFPNDPSGRGRDMTFPASFSEQISATPAYRDLQSKHVARASSDVLREAEAAARAVGWKITATDPASGSIIANDTTKLFRFVDDIIIRVRDDGLGGSIVDVRSKSRDGKGDNGTNAARIRLYFQALPG
jgi:hypothetical protein